MRSRKDGSLSPAMGGGLGVVLLLQVALWNEAMAAEFQQDYLVFGALTASRASGPALNHGIDRNEREADMTLLYSRQDERYRFFTELYAADQGNYEIARLQLGWRASPQTTLWFGRFHNPQGYWNTQYHHGAYLQTTIGRPGIEEFDDHGGILPSHFIGAQLDGKHNTDGGGSLRYELGAGVSGDMDDEGLESPQIIGPAHRGRETASFRLTWRPEDGEPATLGVFFGENHLRARDLAFQEVRQNVAGLFGVYPLGELRLLGAAFAVRNELLGGSGGAGGFVAAYVQAEYPLGDWTPYARAEDSRGTDDDAYLDMFHHFVKDRGMAGVRRDLGHKQAVKIEYEQSRAVAGRFNKLGVQWSIVYP